MAAHPSECEEADVGSLCDCDCAGARHAVRRTKGAVPGAGQVSKRAQKIAAANGRASVVNNLAESSGRGRYDKTPPPPDKTPPPPDKTPPKQRRRVPQPPGDEVRPDGLPDGKPDPVRTATRTPRFSPTTKAQLRKVRDGLPKTQRGWQGLATDKADAATRRRLDAAVELAKDAVAGIDLAVEALYAEHAKAEQTRILRSKEYKQGHYGTKEQVAKMAQAVAPHKAWDDPRWEPLMAEKARAQSDLFHAEYARERALKQGAYPVDEKTGIKQPTGRLMAKLNAVRDAGRAALAEARAAWEKDPPKPVQDAAALVDKHTRAKAALDALTRRKFLLDGLGAGLGGTSFSVPLPDGPVHITSREQFSELQTRWARELLTVGGVDRVREARQTIARHQSETLMAMLSEQRGFGGHHTNVAAGRDPSGAPSYGATRAREDWRERLAVAERYFPADWIARSSKDKLRISASDRAYYNPASRYLSMNTDSAGDATRDGALNYIDEVNVHELGHRMEVSVPGLTYLEFAYVRERGRNDDGTVQPVTSLGYADKREAAQADKWGNAYAGKSYEAPTSAAPGTLAWEVFQVGLQDLFARSSTRYGPTDDPEQLQAFVVGALLTLG